MGGALPHGFTGFLEQIFDIPGLSSGAGLRSLAAGGPSGQGLQGSPTNHLPLNLVIVFLRYCVGKPGTIHSRFPDSTTLLGYELGMRPGSGLLFILDSYVAPRFSGHTRFFFSLGLGILHLFSPTPGCSSFLSPDF